MKIWNNLFEYKKKTLSWAEIRFEIVKLWQHFFVQWKNIYHWILIFFMIAFNKFKTLVKKKIQKCQSKILFYTESN